MCFVFQRANIEKIKADMAQTEKALEMYKFNELQYPTTSQGLDALVVPHGGLKNPILYPEGGYISSIPLDPWGKVYYSTHLKSQINLIYTLRSRWHGGRIWR